jgi:hypothetical protein
VNWGEVGPGTDLSQNCYRWREDRVSNSGPGWFDRLVSLVALLAAAAIPLLAGQLLLAIAALAAFLLLPRSVFIGAVAGGLAGMAFITMLDASELSALPLVLGGVGALGGLVVKG